MSRRALQICTAVLGLVPIGSGLLGLMGLRDPLYVRYGVVPNVVLDSNLRFLSGVWLAAGLVILSIVPRIERETALFRVLWGMIFLGGVGRVLSLVQVGSPPVPFLGVLGLELIGAPLFVAWQARVARAARLPAPREACSSEGR